MEKSMLIQVPNLVMSSLIKLHSLAANRRDTIVQNCSGQEIQSFLGFLKHDADFQLCL